MRYAKDMRDRQGHTKRAYVGKMRLDPVSLASGYVCGNTRNGYISTEKKGRNDVPGVKRENDVKPTQAT